MLGDITIYKQANGQSGSGTQSINVAASTWIIQPGEPISLVAGASACIPASGTMYTVPSAFVPYSVTGTGFLGIAETISSNTASLAGSVDFAPSNSQSVYLCNAQTPSLIATQALYDALVGHRVLLNVNSPGVVNTPETTNGGGQTYTVLLTDSALNGFIVRPLNVFKFPNKVAISPVDGISAFG